MSKWDDWFMRMAKQTAILLSKDPSTKVGAVIADGKYLVSVGFNGFPVGVDDSPTRYEDRPLKYKLVVHAEMNALITALRNGRSVRGCSLYTWPIPPCVRCVGPIINAGITTVIFPLQATTPHNHDEMEYTLALNTLTEGGVTIHQYPNLELPT